MSDAVDEIVTLYSGPEADALYDESVTEREHALQAAALAATTDADDALVAAALLHDIGHLIVGDLFASGEPLTRDHRHELVGAGYLRRSFPKSVTEPVRLHVAAKRYLCTVEPSYRARLSPASMRSLEVQGGAFEPAEVAEFEADPAAAAAAQVRRWDDEAKQADLEVAPFETYLPLLERFVTSRT